MTLQLPDCSRFLEDETFPHTVTAYIETEKMFCSGAILAAQSDILEAKIRADGGELMFEEMLGLENLKYLKDCLKFLHGAKVKINANNLEVLMKFNCVYALKCPQLFEKCLTQCRTILKCNKEIKHVALLLKIAKNIDSAGKEKLLSVVKEFIIANSALVLKKLSDKMNEESSEIDSSLEEIAVMVMTDLPHCLTSEYLMQWITKSKCLKDHVICVGTALDMYKIFPDSEKFSEFIEALSEGVESAKGMKDVMKFQQEYFKALSKCKELVIKEEEVVNEKEEDDEQNLDEKDIEESGSEKGDSKVRAEVFISNAQKPSQKEPRKRNKPPKRIGDASSSRRGNTPDRRNVGKQRVFNLDNPTNRPKLHVQELENQSDRRCLYVGQVHPATSESELKGKLGFFGRIESITLLDSRTSGGYKFAFVKFESLADALNLLKEAETTVIALKGCPLKISAKR